MIRTNIGKATRLALGGLILSGFAVPASALTLSFEQLDWESEFSSTSDSAWGMVTLDFMGESSPRFFNLNVDGRWVVQNMYVGSYSGVGVAQQVQTSFDLAVVNGTDVASLEYAFSFDDAPAGSIPGGSMTHVSVADAVYSIGGEEGGDTGLPGPPPERDRPLPATKHAVLRDINLFENQEQSPRECTITAISGSLKYLQATGQLSDTIPSDKSDIDGWLGRNPQGYTPGDWYIKKKEHFERVLDVNWIESLSDDAICQVAAALEAGKDVELDLDGHVAVVVGLHYYPDGRLDLDIYHDRQTIPGISPLETVAVNTLTGQILGRKFERFVIEAPVPESSPGWVSLGVCFAGAAIFRRWRESRHPA